MVSKRTLSMRLAQLKKLAYFTIQLIFAIIYGPTILFGIIHESHYTISTNFYLYLQYFQQKVFNFNKINGFQTDHQFFHHIQ